MKSQISGEEESLVEADGKVEPSGSEDKSDVQLADGKDAARSVENIASWRTFLPEGCVDTMIRMGWDRRT
jgi:hypothetical protein